MRNLQISTTYIHNILQTKISLELIKEIEKVTSESKKLLVYTSFDGDLLSRSELMKQFVLKRNKVPLNPESALGTYLVTNHYKGEKFQIIVDCLSLLLLCDEFIVMTDFLPKSTKDLVKLPEGVLAELIYWVNNKNNTITIVNTNNFQSINLEIDMNFIDYIHPQMKLGITNILDIERTQLRKCIYLLSSEKHAKHSDWLRLDAYNNNYVPVCPYTLINESTLRLAFGSDALENIRSRHSLGSGLTTIGIYGQWTDSEFKIENLDNDTLIELFTIFKSDLDVLVIYKSFAEIGIPKYVDRQKWAVTQYEKENPT